MESSIELQIGKKFRKKRKALDDAFVLAISTRLAAVWWFSAVECNGKGQNDRLQPQCEQPQAATERRKMGRVKCWPRVAAKTVCFKVCVC